MANMNFGVNILPKTDNAQYLGTSDKQWKIYSSDINGIPYGDSALTTSATNVTGAINEINASVAGLAQRIGNVEAPASVFQDFQFSIAQNAWTVVDAAYQAEVSNVNITATSGIWVFYDASYQSYAQAAITAEVYSSGGKAIFRTATQPTGAIGGYIRVIDSISGIIPIERGGTAANTLAGAQSNLGITELNGKLSPSISSPSVESDRATLTSGGYITIGKMVIVNFVVTATYTASNSPTVAHLPAPTADAALSCVDITRGMGTAIESAVPCGVRSSNGYMCIKTITNGNIYAITGAYIKK